MTMRLRFLLAGAALAGLLAAASALPGRGDASDALFDQGQIPKLKVTVPAEALAKLKTDPRAYVRASVEENGKVVHENVGLKLKGAAGSFRDVNDRPALTLNFDKFAKGQLFHDLDKLHLNNSVQDESYLCELLCGELFRQAGVPAARVTHARVWLNGRDLGLYVLKEGFGKTFLRRWFKKAGGNLYDGGFLQDLDAALKRDSGDGPEDRADLKALAAACREADPLLRRQRLEQLVDLDSFLTFMALERMTCHWDGYCWNMNNYRVYFDPQRKQALFLPHGMDQMFGDPGMGLFDHPRPMLSAAVMQTDSWRKRYRERVQALLPLLSPPEKLLARAEEVRKRLEPTLAELGPARAQEHAQRVKELKERIAARAANLREQLARPEPATLQFDGQGTAKLADWHPVPETEDTKVAEANFWGKRLAYTIAVGKKGQPAVASWRREALLAAGDYKLCARVRTKNVDPLPDDPKGGVALRMPQAERKETLRGTTDWRPLEFAFTVREDQRVVELALELRAKAGQVWFDAASVELRRVGPAGKAE